MQINCQIPTPREYVKTMLDLAGYTEELYGKTILENSCGEGGITCRNCTTLYNRQQKTQDILMKQLK